MATYLKQGQQTESLIVSRIKRYHPTVSAAVTQFYAIVALFESLIQNNKECERGQLSPADNLSSDRYV